MPNEEERKALCELLFGFRFILLSNSYTIVDRIHRDHVKATPKFVAPDEGHHDVKATSKFVASDDSFL